MLLIDFSFSATPEQIEQYIMLSDANRDLIEMKQTVESIIPPTLTSNTLIITAYFNEYLTKHLTSNEIDKLIKLYNNPLLNILKELNQQISTEERQAFKLMLKENPYSKKRLAVAQKITQNIFDSEDLKNIRYGLQEKISEAFGGEQESEFISQKKEKQMLERMRNELKLSLLYCTQNLTIEELKKLQKLTKNPLLKKATKVEIDASLYAVELFLKAVLMEFIEK